MKDQAIYQYILRHFADMGRPPAARDIGRQFALSRPAVRAALERLEAARAFYRDPRTHRIVAAYPFSAKPTVHIVYLPDGQARFALCAIDALGMPLMLRSNATITSVCEHCGREIAVEVRRGK